MMNIGAYYDNYKTGGNPAITKSKTNVTAIDYIDTNHQSLILYNNSNALNGD